MLKMKFKNLSKEGLIRLVRSKNRLIHKLRNRIGQYKYCERNMELRLRKIQNEIGNVIEHPFKTTDRIEKK